jgi:hypothetical protein
MKVVLFFPRLGFSYGVLHCKILMKQFDIFMNHKIFEYKS